jgi:hypothetical protein
MLVEVRDERGNFEGFEGRECGDHRTVGDYRAWCFDCVTWCYPEAPCPGCEHLEEQRDEYKAKYEALSLQYEKLKHEWGVEREGRKIADGEFHAVLRKHGALVEEVRRIYEWNGERTCMVEVEFDGPADLDPKAWPAHASALGQGSGDIPAAALREQPDLPEEKTGFDITDLVREWVEAEDLYPELALDDVEGKARVAARIIAVKARLRKKVKDV